MKKFIRAACVIAGVVAGLGDRALGVDPLGPVSLAYSPADGSISVDAGGHVFTTLHITTKIDFFTGTKPPEVGAIFDQFFPRKLFILDLNGFGDLSFPPGTVSQAISPAQLAEGMDVDASYLDGTRLDAWCFAGVSCFWKPSAGDFNDDSTLDVSDINTLTDAVIGSTTPLPSESRRFDLDFDGTLTQADRQVWINSVKKTYIGDSNSDGEFNSRDLVTVFQVGEYEDGVARNSYWQDGDWDGNLDFDSQDLVSAFQANGYFQGPRAASAVPEPSGSLLGLLFVYAVFVVRRAGHVLKGV
jgi:hypothetical protein